MLEIFGRVCNIASCHPGHKKTSLKIVPQGLVHLFYAGVACLVPVVFTRIHPDAPVSKPFLWVLGCLTLNDKDLTLFLKESLRLE